MASSTLFDIINAGAGVNTDGFTAATGSITPIADITYVMVGSLNSAGQSSEHTLSGTNGWSTTWSAITTLRNAANTERLTMFRGTPPSTTAGILTGQSSGEIQDAWIIKPVCIENLGSAVPVQSASATTTTTTTGVHFSGALADVWNPVLMGVMTNSASGSIVLAAASGNFITPQANASDGLRALFVFRPNNTSGMTVTTPTGDDVAIMLELDHDGSDVGSGSGVAAILGSFDAF